ncbi:uncharacterized protein A4U43_C06F4830 [Asparagus officinalis]|uniref:Uncharacterized protein n=1 Tax=Asparagus officinalis TaxID=4686 RepID=A0A5P1EJL2_ASPOF|nr:uncharacterized protein A4U43_C06F4830 [Asparagus officinalis]
MVRWEEMEEFWVRDFEGFEKGRSVEEREREEEGGGAQVRWAKREIDRRRLDKLMPASFGYDVKQSSVFGCECCICIEEFAQGDRCRLL